MRAYVAENPLFIALLKLLVLWMMVIVTALSVAYSSHLCRENYAQLAAAERLGHQLQADYGRYVLEQSAWGSLQRVERLAEDELGMLSPVASEIVLVDQMRSGGL
ncbi:MAG TPA: cell division protein FtsL [Porticoccaceae bacterium]|nr:cell division protein FtsL [Porticoccaceae bacterium]